ncbi:MAG: hydrolase [Campylobacterota bacterium]|nr:hydrolase [Campylobacterota bacterium]
MQPFQPSFFFKNRHTQTLYSSFFRKLPNLEIEIETFELDDGDFVECHWYNKPKINSSTPIIILFHGLAGSYKSPYIQGVMSEAKKEGFASVVMHFRGCSGKENHLPRAYHSGDSGDALAWIETIQQRYKHSKIFTVGYSLGGNMILKLLGELGENSPISASVSVSAPLQLDICADAIDNGFSKFYQWHLIKALNLSLEKKYNKHDMESLINLKKDKVKKIKTFWEFDNIYTAPIHGFDSAQDYYTKCSSKQFLKDIKTPTLIIHAIDDPFMDTKIIPKKEELSKHINLELSENGGHVGFIGGTFFKPNYWLEKRIVKYFKGYLGE